MRIMVGAVLALCLAAEPFPVLAQDSGDGLRTIQAAQGLGVRVDDSPVVGEDGKPRLEVFALGFYQGEKPIYEYRLGDLVAKPALLETDGGKVRWIRESSLDGEAFHLTTLDGQIYEFHIPTGQIRYLKKKYR